jgi:hypothetical protein
MNRLISTLGAGALLMSTALALAQAEGEPIRSADEAPLGGFEGCTMAPPKDGCDARITCTGVGNIFANTARDVQLATREATSKARSQLATFYSSKQRAKEAIANASKSTQGPTNTDGSSTGSTESERLMVSIDETSAEEVLRGVQVLGRQVDGGQRTVTVKVGVSCRSQAAAARSQAGVRQPAAAAAAPQSGGGQPAPAAAPTQGQRIPPMELRSFEQKRKNADEF